MPFARGEIVLGLVSMLLAGFTCVYPPVLLNACDHPIAVEARYADGETIRSELPPGERAFHRRHASAIESITVEVAGKRADALDQEALASTRSARSGC